MPSPMAFAVTSMSLENENRISKKALDKIVNMPFNIAVNVFIILNNY